MKKEVKYNERDEHGVIIYGTHPLGLFVVSGHLGPNPYKQPDITLTDGMTIEIDDETGLVSVPPAPPAEPPAAHEAAAASHEASKEGESGRSRSRF